MKSSSEPAVKRKLHGLKALKKILCPFVACVVHHFVKDYFTADIFLLLLSEHHTYTVVEFLSPYLNLYLKP